MKGHHLVILFLYEGGMLVLDVAIIGGGPAALSAALNCRQRNKTVTIFGRSLDSSLLFAAEKVDNYLGRGRTAEYVLCSRHEKRCRIQRSPHQSDHVHGRFLHDQCGK